MLDHDRTALDRYVANAKAHALLSADEEQTLARRWRERGDRDARERLVLANLRFVLKIAHEYTGYGVPLAELVQEGNVGLLIAADRFDPARGHRFVSYAVWWIRAMILSHVQRAASVVRSGTTAEGRRAFFKARAARRELEATLQRAVSPAEVAAALGVGEASVNDFEQRVGLKDMPLDANVLERIADRAPTPEDAVAEKEAAHAEHMRLLHAIAGLDERERAVVRRRHLSEDPDSLAAIGADYAVSRERIRQLELRALNKLRVALAA